MKIAIIYISSHGTTERAALKLKESLKGEVDLINLKDSAPDLEDYDAVIIGSSIHVGTIPTKLRKFIEANQGLLLNKRIGLFLCCMLEGEQAQKQFEDNYPQILRERSIANGIFGGEFLFDKMNFVQRMIVKKVSGVTATVHKLDFKEITAFADKFSA